jgi:hypothetical protein
LLTQWNRVYDRDQNAIGLFVVKRQVNLLPCINTPNSEVPTMYVESVESDKVYKCFADQLTILHANCKSRKFYDVNRIMYIYI